MRRASDTPRCQALLPRNYLSPSYASYSRRVRLALQEGIAPDMEEEGEEEDEEEFGSEVRGVMK